MKTSIKLIILASILGLAIHYIVNFPDEVKLPSELIQVSNFLELEIDKNDLNKKDKTKDEIKINSYLKRVNLEKYPDILKDYKDAELSFNILKNYVSDGDNYLMVIQGNSMEKHKKNLKRVSIGLEKIEKVDEYHLNVYPSSIPNYPSSIPNNKLYPYRWHGLTKDESKKKKEVPYNALYKFKNNGLIENVEASEIFMKITREKENWQMNIASFFTKHGKKIAIKNIDIEQFKNIEFEYQNVKVFEKPQILIFNNQVIEYGIKYSLSQCRSFLEKQANKDKSLRKNKKFIQKLEDPTEEDIKKYIEYRISKSYGNIFKNYYNLNIIDSNTITYLINQTWENASSVDPNGGKFILWDSKKKIKRVVMDWGVSSDLKEDDRFHEIGYDNSYYFGNSIKKYDWTPSLGVGFTHDIFVKTSGWEDAHKAFKKSKDYGSLWRRAPEFKYSKYWRDVHENLNMLFDKSGKYRFIDIRAVDCEKIRVKHNRSPIDLIGPIIGYWYNFCDGVESFVIEGPGNKRYKNKLFDGLISNLQVSPDGKNIAFVWKNKLVINGEYVVDKSYKEISNIEFSSDGKNLLFYGKRDDKMFSVDIELSDVLGK